MLNLAMEFFELNDIAVNAKKTILIVLNPTVDPEALPILFGKPALPVLPISTSEGTRYLGCHISADGKQGTQRRLISELVTAFTDQLLPKQITDFQAIYLVNRVLIPSILAHCILMVPSPDECMRWTRQYLNVVKRKAKLPKDTPSAILFHSRFYKLANLGDAMSEMHISELWLRLNSPASSLAGELTRLRLMALHSQHMTMESPVTQPTSEVSMHGHNLIARVLPLMAERAIKFSIPSGWGAIEKGAVGISSLFENWVKFQPHCLRLRSHGLVALE